MRFRDYLLFLSVVGLSLSLAQFISIPAHGQALTPAEDEERAVASLPKSRRFLNLTVGIEFDERVAKLPEGVSFRGTFRNIAGANYSREQNLIRFTPTREGDGTLTIHDKNGKMIAEYLVKVRKSKLDSVASEMKELLGDIEGINIKIINNKVVIDGQILLPRDMNRIYNVVSQYGDQASSLVTLSPLAQKKIAEFIARDINNPEIEVRAVNDIFILQGVANSEDEKARAEIIAKTYIPSLILDRAEQDQVVRRRRPANDGVINLIGVKATAPAPPKKIIQLVVHYVELQKDYSRGFRFQFMPSLKEDSGIQFSTGDRGDSGVVTQITGTITNLLPKLNWAKQHGHARVLQSSTVMVEDGRKGVINSVQEVPFQTAGERGIPVTSFKEVGMATSITPVILGERSDSISLEMDFELSALVGQTDAGPLMSKNKINTGLVVRNNQSAAVGGLVTNRSVTGFNKLPKGVDGNPILSLYASKDFTKGQSQFVVFVTPSIKSSASSGADKIKKKFRLGQ